MRARHTSVLVPFLALQCLWPHAGEARPPTSWSKATTTAPGKAQSHGGYSAGCVVGAQILPSDHASYQVMKPERRRHYGHPKLVKFVQKLALSAATQGLSPLAVGDLGQPRGGPAPNGHASHQSGLDVDLWFTPVSSERTQHSVVNLPSNQRSKHWTSRVPKLLKLASSAPEVARIFVNPIIKQQICEEVTGDRKWLRKLRPWYGHHEHFHVRLSCPNDSPGCQNQSMIPAGDGCQELEWWLSAQHKKDRQKGGAKYSKRVGAKSKLPAPCQAIQTNG